MSQTQAFKKPSKYARDLGWLAALSEVCKNRKAAESYLLQMLSELAQGSPSSQFAD